MRSGLTWLRWSAWLLLPGATLSAGEPIRFSGRAGPPLARAAMGMERAPFLPTEARTDRSLTRPELPVDAFLVPSQAITPTTGLTRRQAEEQERRRNWLLQSPETLQQDANKSDEEKHRTARDERDKRDERDAPKSALARYLEDQDRQSDPAGKDRNPGPGRKTDRNASGPRNRASGAGNDDAENRSRTGWEARAAGTPRGGPDDTGWFGAGDARGGTVGRALSEAKERERERERAASLETFKRTFANPWVQPAPDGGNALTAPGGAAAAGMGVPGGDFRRATVSGGLAPGLRAGTEFGPRGGFSDFDPKNPLNYGASATVLRQPEPPRPTSKPIVLEVPKRKF